MVSLDMRSTSPDICTGICYYSSVSDCVCHLMNVPNLWVYNATLVVCSSEDVLYEVLDLDTQTVHRMCMSAGMTAPCNIAVMMPYCICYFRDKQATSPLLFIDRSAYLPVSVCAQWNEFLTKCQHTERTPSDMSAGRGCLLFGAATYDNYVVTVWTIRSTVNYSTWAYEAPGLGHT